MSLRDLAERTLHRHEAHVRTRRPGCECRNCCEPPPGTDIVVPAQMVLTLLDIAYEVAGIVKAGQLPEAETAILADMLAQTGEVLS